MPRMTEQLGYAPPVPRNRRVGFVVLLTIPFLIGAYVLAIPKIRTFRDHQACRDAVRRQFETELSNARKDLDANNLDQAATALFKAEFPVRVERHLFRHTTLAGFDRRLTDLHSRIVPALAKKRVDEERQARQAEAQRKREEEEERRQGIYVIRCYFGFGSEDNRQRTLSALQDRAAVVLRNGRNQQAFGICQQIVVLDPGHTFDAEFWSNVQPQP
jgi:septal ring factor EnvC (AmiA/AmiB activator)